MVMATISRPRLHGATGRTHTRQQPPYSADAARELPQLSLLDALELTMLIARKDTGRFQRGAARWLQRLLEENPD
jgi:hypothetical protein